MVESKAPDYNTAIIVGSIAVLGGLIYMVVHKAPVLDPAAIEEQSVVYNDGNNEISAGQSVTAVITAINTGQVAGSIKFRCDLLKTGIASPKEGSWKTFTLKVSPNPQTFTVSSIAIPSDWGNGQNFTARVILNGIDGDWNISDILTVGTATTALEKQSVVYNGGNTVIRAGQEVSAEITVLNTSIPGTVRFRCDLLKTGIASPNEGNWETFNVEASPYPQTFTVYSIAIPSDWGNGQNFTARVILDGKDGDWDISGMLAVGAGQPEVSVICSSDGTVTVFFSGFHPNSMVTITIIQTGGYITGNTDSHGAGNISFNDSDPAGHYTAQVSDNYGNSASGDFTLVY